MTTYILGGGIAALIDSFFTGHKILFTGISYPPSASYLHHTLEAFEFLRRLKLEPKSRVVSHVVWDQGKLHDWPGTAQHRANHFAKSRLRMGVQPASFEATKAQTNLTACYDLCELYDNLYDFLKYMGRVIDLPHRVPQLTRLPGDRWLVGTNYEADELRLAMPPKLFGFKPKTKERTWIAVDSFRARNGLIADYIYIADPQKTPFRLTKTGHDTFVAETAVLIGANVGIDTVTMDVSEVIEEVARHHGRVQRPGYDAVSYHLPKNLTLVGRAATGQSLLTHDLIRSYIQ